MFIATWKFLTSLSLPQRIISSLVVSLIAGPALVGFVSEYATYCYAVRSGVRPPVEGIPFLRASVTLACIFLSLAVGIAIILARQAINELVVLYLWSWKFIVSRAKKWGLDTIFKLEGDPPENPMAALEGVIARIDIKNLFAWYAAFLFTTSFATFYLEGVVAALTLAFSMVLAVTIMLSVWRPGFIWLAATLVGIALQVICIFSLFNQQHFGTFLARIGFGGNVPVVIYYKNSLSPISMQLVLRSGDWFIGRSCSASPSAHIEIPVEQVLRIEYRGPSSACP